MRIIIGVDGSHASGVACELVASRTWPIGTRVVLVRATEPVLDLTGLTPPTADLRETKHEALGLILDDRAETLRATGLGIETTIEAGRAGEVLIDKANESFADLIVVGSRGRGPLTSAVLGSVSAHLVDHAPCPVLVARSPSITRMLLATDGTPSSRSIPRILAAWGNAFRGLPVEVLSVAPPDAFVTPWSTSGDVEFSPLTLHEAIAEGVADELMELGFHSAAVSRAGDTTKLIVSEGREWGADLIVTGSRGIGTVHRLVSGSVAHDVLTRARSSVLVVRGGVPAPLTRALASAALA